MDKYLIKQILITDAEIIESPEGPRLSIEIYSTIINAKNNQEIREIIHNFSSEPIPNLPTVNLKDKEMNIIQNLKGKKF